MTDRPLRIAIATNGRFHVLDLARELAALGHDVTFYSLLPKSRTRHFGLADRYCVSLFAPMLPIILWQRFLPGLAADLRERVHNSWLNRLIAFRLKPCEVFIGMSGMIVEAALAARRRYGARIFAERGSKHIEAQAEILAAQGAAGPSPYAIAREKRSYAIADRILIPAEHVARSFDRDPAARAKTLSNPYGVDLEEFPSRPPRDAGVPTVVFAGGWLLRKGVDLLSAAMAWFPDARFVHVGAAGDHPFPDHPRFRHVGRVDQRQLKDYYADADVFAIASREEGLALVQVQALATGLMLVCSDQTGGRDLRYTPALAARIREVPVDDVDALADAIADALAASRSLPPLPDADRALLSWRAYAERYVAHMRRDLAGVGRL